MTLPSRSARAVSLLQTELRETGLLELLEDPEVTDIMVNPETVFLGTHDRGTVDAGLTVASDRLENLIASLAGIHGLVIDRRNPVLEADLPVLGARAQAVLPPVTQAPLLTLRKPSGKTLTLSELVANSTMPNEAAELLRSSVRSRNTLLIAGGVGSGKTTLLRALLLEIVAQNPEERLVICEEGARELTVPGANVVQMLASPEAGVDMTRLLRCALRLNPDRILVGEARGPEALDFLRAANTGHPGGMLTLHANSALDAVYRLDDLTQEAGVPSQLRRIAASIQRLVYVRKAAGQRQVEEILTLRGSTADGELRTARAYLRDATVKVDERSE